MESNTNPNNVPQFSPKEDRDFLLGEILKEFENKKEDPCAKSKYPARNATETEYLAALQSALEQSYKLGLNLLDAVKLFAERLQSRGGLKHLGAINDNFIDKL